jgi:hypothetical protein
MDMPSDQFMNYYVLIDRFLSEDAKRSIQSSSFPHLKERKDKEKILKMLDQKCGIKPQIQQMDALKGGIIGR